MAEYFRENFQGEKTRQRQRVQLPHEVEQNNPLPIAFLFNGKTVDLYITAVQHTTAEGQFSVRMSTVKTAHSYVRETSHIGRLVCCLQGVSGG